jgi:hypothetical protein
MYLALAVGKGPCRGAELALANLLYPRLQKCETIKLMEVLCDFGRGALNA